MIPICTPSESQCSSANEVAPGLLMGDAPPERARPPGINTVVLCAKEYQPRRAFGGLRTIHAPLDDSGPPITTEEIATALHAGRLVAAELRSGRKVLVTCAMGLNRSGLITALALRLGYGLSANRAIARVRAARGPRALSNPSFVELIRRVHP